MMWFFALLTGFSASVIRASVMYTVYQIGVFTKRKVNLPNTLFSSSFLILIVDPMMLTDIGFQLSFFAVLGIVAIQPFFTKVYEPSKTIFKALWGLLTVSISAQLGVLPISLLYFKQFPNLFIISNIFEVTLSTITLYVGLVNMIFAPIDFLSAHLCLVLNFLIKMMNSIALYLSHIPFAVSTLHITPLQAFLIGTFILCLVALIRSKKIQFLKLATFTLCMWCITTCTYNYIIYSNQSLILYANKKAFVTDLYTSGGLIRFVNNTSITENARFKKVLDLNRLKNTLSVAYNEVNIENYRSVTFTVSSKVVQILNTPDAICDHKTNIAYINYQVKSKSLTLPSKTLLVVMNQKSADGFRKMGFTNIHCLESDGAFTL